MTENAKTVQRHRQTHVWNTTNAGSSGHGHGQTRDRSGGINRLGENGPSLGLGGICFTTVTKFICTKAKQKQ